MKAKAKATPDSDQLPDGVYIGLSEERYFAQDALGSSDLRNLWLYEAGWWWQSPNNPYWTRRSSDPTDYGSALHAITLEGREAFEARYFIAPDPRDFPDLLVTAPQIFSALRDSDAPAISPRSKKADMVEMAKVYLPGRHIWDEIEERARRKAGKRTVLPAETAWQLGVMLEAAMQDDTMRAFCTAEGGVRLTEVSVFWTLPTGTRLRFRFDSLLPAANGDLKSIDNYRAGDDLPDAVGKAIGNGALDVQAALSFTARRMMYAAIGQGRVFINPNPPDGAGDPLEQAAWLARFPREAPLDLDGQPGWRWLWMFFQKPDQAGRAPTLLPVWLDFGGMRHRDGYRKAVHALSYYHAKVAEVGLERPWTAVLPPHHLDGDPAAPLDREIRIPSWVRQPLAVDGEEQELSWRK